MHKRAKFWTIIQKNFQIVFALRLINDIIKTVRDKTGNTISIPNDGLLNQSRS